MSRAVIESGPYSHSRLELTWKGTRKPLVGLVLTSVIASPTVQPAAQLRVAKQHLLPGAVCWLPAWGACRQLGAGERAELCSVLSHHPAFPHHAAVLNFLPSQIYIFFLLEKMAIRMICEINPISRQV